MTTRTGRFADLGAAGFVGLWLIATVSASLGGCSARSIEIDIGNETSRTLLVELRVDRVGSSGGLLTSGEVGPGARTTLGPVTGPPLEYVELIVGRPGDFGAVPTTQRVPRGASSWVIEPSVEAWDGFALRRVTETDGDESPR